MLPAFQVSAYAMGPEDLKTMEHCKKALSDLGRQMVALVKLGFEYPPEFVKGPGAFGTYNK
jgi:hypothetical protein